MKSKPKKRIKSLQNRRLEFFDTEDVPPRQVILRVTDEKGNKREIELPLLSADSKIKLLKKGKMQRYGTSIRVLPANAIARKQMRRVIERTVLCKKKQVVSEKEICRAISKVIDSSMFEYTAIGFAKVGIFEKVSGFIQQFVQRICVKKKVRLICASLFDDLKDDSYLNGDIYIDFDIPGSYGSSGNKESFGRFLKRLMKRAEIKGCNMAERLGVCDKSVSNWVTDKNLPGKDTLVAIAMVLHLPASLAMKLFEYAHYQFYDVPRDYALIQCIDRANRWGIYEADKYLKERNFGSLLDEAKEKGKGNRSI